MANFSLSIRDWLTIGEEVPEHGLTTGWLEIRVGDRVLTRNEDVWSRTVREAVLVSAYPLAYWLAWNWWRLSWDPLPTQGQPPLNWRMAHELGAVDHGYVWPSVLFASDGETIQIWSEPLSIPEQSVQYLGGLDGPCSVPLSDFQAEISTFIGMVLHRLSAVGQHDTDLAHLWARISQERNNPETERRRRLEARLGFDPDQCPKSLLSALLDLQTTTGESALAELAPVYGRQGNAASEIAALGQAEGVKVIPQIKPLDGHALSIPWQRGVEAARRLREQIGHTHEPIRNDMLFDLLGLPSQARLDEVTDKRRPVSVMRPIGDDDTFVFLPRKQYPTGRRFELARILGDWLMTPPTHGREWRIASDVATACQKQQRAFAAEFLCPIAGLTEFLNGDFSDTAIEEASEHFAVSEWTVRSLLANNGLLPRFEPSVPYALTA